MAPFSGNDELREFGNSRGKVKRKQELFPDYMRSARSDNFQKNNLSAIQEQVNLICTSLQISIAHSNETLPSYLYSLKMNRRGTERQVKRLNQRS